MEKKVLEYNKKGVFPLDGETKEQYIERAKKILKGSKDRAYPFLEKVYDVSPQWVKVCYRAKNLHFFEAGCTFFEGEKVWIEMRPQFEKRGFFLWYSFQEVFSHECIHSVRYPLESEKYEEFFAYFLSSCLKRKTRSFLGPLFSNTREVLLFSLSAILPLFSFMLGPLSLLAPFVVLLYFILRLNHRWNRWVQCQKKVPLPLMVRLKDEEIDLFARMSKEDIKEYIEEKKKDSFRWAVLSEYVEK